MRLLIRILASAAVVVLIGALVSVAYARFAPDLPASPEAPALSAPALSSDARLASTTVAAFGREEQYTQLNAPDAASQITKNYGPYVVPSLLSQWQSDPQSAPGRVVSSPWPDHIIVHSVTQTAQGYEVLGTLYLLSSVNRTQGGYQFADPIVIELVKQGGAWLIASYRDLSAG